MYKLPELSLPKVYKTLGIGLNLATSIPPLTFTEGVKKRWGHGAGVKNPRFLTRPCPHRFKLQQRVWKLKQTCDALRIAACLPRIWYSSFHSALRTSGNKAAVLSVDRGFRDSHEPTTAKKRPLMGWLLYRANTNYLWCLPSDISRVIQATGFIAAELTVDFLWRVSVIFYETELTSLEGILSAKVV